MIKIIRFIVFIILLSLPDLIFYTTSNQLGFVIAGVLRISVHLAVSFALILKWDEIIDRFFLGKTKYDYETALSKKELEDFQEWKRLNALDQKLQTGHYTNAEKETFLYTSQLRPENKEYLRSKHLPPKNGKNTPIQQ